MKNWLFLVVLIVVVVFGVIVVGSCFAKLSFKVEGNKAVITDVKADQPVPYQGPNGQTMAVPGAKATVTTVYAGVSKDDASIQIIKLNTMRSQIADQANTQLANIDVQIKLLKDIVAALPELVTEPIE